MSPLIIVLIVIGSLLIVFFVAIALLYRNIIYSPLKGQINDFDLQKSKNFQGYEDALKQLIIKLMARPYEDIYVQSFDKLKLHARFFENKGSNKYAILCHGYRGTAYRDFCGGANEAIEMGYNVILIDERAHGTSQGHSITFGIREVQDLLSWVAYARNRFGQNIELALIGISMGGATVLMAADKVGENVKIIADSPYSSPKIMLKETIRSIHLPVPIFYFLVNFTSILFAHTNLNKLSAYDSVKNTNNKILIIHGNKDSVVNYKISEDLFKTYPDKIQYELFDGADHGVSYLTDTERYQKIIRDFLI